MTHIPSRSAGRRKVWLVQQSVWRTDETARATMPLASGYLKALADGHPDLAGALDVRIFNFAGDEAVAQMLKILFFDERPDILAMSLFGWNTEPFRAIAETFKQLNPDGWVIWGGTHATHQEETVFRRTDAVDIVVNGEGERTWVALLQAYLAGVDRRDLDPVAGIGFRTAGFEYIRTPRRERIVDLDEIPSPILSGALPLVDADGRPLYPYVLMETNRGCPYACGFCYWGGAVGQKVRSFSLDRLREEVELVARAGYDEIMLCDANFGMLAADEAFVDLCIEARERHGGPGRIFTSWAKNKGRVFRRIVKRLREARMEGGFNLALQSLSEPVIEAMGRKNMKINDWEELSSWLKQQDYDVYAELIWGCPGETVQSFLEGYDHLARHISRIAVYPLLIMPNTDYSDNRQAYGLVTWRPGVHDFELVLAHDTMSIADNRRMHGFLFWARVVAEHLVFRNLWAPLHALTDWTQSRVMLSFDAWLDRSDHRVAPALRQVRDEVVDRLEVSSSAIERGLRLLYTLPDLPAFLTAWWREAVAPDLPEDVRPVLDDAFRLDVLTLPFFVDETGRPPPGVERDEARGGHVRRGVRLDTDAPAIVRALRAGQDAPTRAHLGPAVYDIRFRDGFCNDMQLYHNAHNLRFFGHAEPGAPMAGAAAGSRNEAEAPGDPAPR